MAGAVFSLMGAKEIVENLEQSKEFSKWRKANKEAYLAHVFTMKEKDRFDSWQVGYYNKAKERITVFEIGESIEILPESEVFKREETAVRPLDISIVKIDLSDALERALKLTVESYPQIRSDKQILILQNIEQGQLWNITFVSPSMDVLNVKVDAASGEVVSHNLNRLFEFKNFKDDDSLE
jgi:hypothetical protein